MREEDKIKNGILFSPADLELKAIKLRAHDLNMDYNRTYECEGDRRRELIMQIVGGIGENFFLQGPIFFHYGTHTMIGKNFFANFNLTVQDDALVTIGDNCNFGPNVTIVTPVHPMLPNERAAMRSIDGSAVHLCYAKPVHIGANCWLGANVIVCPGVTIGNGCVIGAGSVVLRDVPPLTFAAGNPCKIIRTLDENDSMKYKPDILANNTVIIEELE